MGDRVPHDIGDFDGLGRHSKRLREAGLADVVPPKCFLTDKERKCLRKSKQPGLWEEHLRKCLICRTVEQCAEGLRKHFEEERRKLEEERKNSPPSLWMRLKL